jgi:hypothetical protein
VRLPASAFGAIGDVVATFVLEPLVPLELLDAPPPLSRAPDYPDAVQGWHVWLLAEDAGGPVLVSPSGAWLEGRAHRAGCVALRDTPETRSLLLRLPVADAALVTGRVHLWGRVLEHEGGFRAGAAYPAELVARDAASAARLGRRYGVPAASVGELAGYARLM